jgi:hypothetical protein
VAGDELRHEASAIADTKPGGDDGEPFISSNIRGTARQRAQRAGKMVGQNMVWLDQLQDRLQNGQIVPTIAIAG